jgi:hypothetical protein
VKVKERNRLFKVSSIPLHQARFWIDAMQIITESRIVQINILMDLFTHNTCLISVLFCNACVKPGNWAVMYLRVSGIYFAYFYDYVPHHKTYPITKRTPSQHVPHHKTYPITKRTPQYRIQCCNWPFRFLYRINDIKPNSFINSVYVFSFTFSPLYDIIIDRTHNNFKVKFPIYEFSITIFRSFVKHVS